MNFASAAAFITGVSVGLALNGVWGGALIMQALALVILSIKIGTS